MEEVREEFIVPQVVKVVSLANHPGRDLCSNFWGLSTQPDERVNFFPDNGDCDVESEPCSSLILEDSLRNCEWSGCTAIATNKCAQCKSAFYCGQKEHQKWDWKRHKNQCTPFRIQFIGLGATEVPTNAAVATRNIAEGQTIFMEKPILVFPLSDSESEAQFCPPLSLPCIYSLEFSCNALDLRPTCLGCLRAEKSLDFPCSHCSLPLCSYNCQFHPGHQAGECEALSSSYSYDLEPSKKQRCPHATYMDIELLRALQLKKYDRRAWSQILEMRDNVRVETYKRSIAYASFRQNLETLVPWALAASGYDAPLVGDVHAILNSLCWRPSVGAAYKLLFATQPAFAHDCIPNTLHYLEEEGGEEVGTGRIKLVTKAAVPIMAKALISVDFTPSPYLPYPLRRRVLGGLLGLPNCMCSRCHKPSVVDDLTVEVACPSCRGGSVCPENASLWGDSVWSCRMCQEDISFTKVQEIESCVKNQLLQKIRVCGGRASELRAFIKRLPSQLDPKHALIYLAWSYIEMTLRPRLLRVRTADPSHVYSHEEMDDFRLIGEYADFVLQHLNCIRPGIWIDKGIAKFHKFYSTLAQVSRDFQNGSLGRKDFIQYVFKSLKTLQEALQTLTVYEGYNVPSVVHITQEATSALTSLKEYVNYFLTQSESDQSLPKMSQVLEHRSLASSS